VLVGKLQTKFRHMLSVPCSSVKQSHCLTLEDGTDGLCRNVDKRGRFVDKSFRVAAIPEMLKIIEVTEQTISIKSN